jgi:uncharacterized protein
MTPEERQLLSALADRVRNVPAQQKDPEAEQFLRQLVAQRPDTVYVLAQTVIMQDFALRNAQTQIEDLQQQLAEMAPPPQQSSGGFLGGLFGGGRPSPQQPPASGSVPRVNPWARQDAPPPPPGYGQGPGYGYGQPQGGPTMQPSQTGNFLRGAATTAVGVAGGALLFQGISSLFSGNHGIATSALAGANPSDSLSETTVVNNYYDDRGGGVQEADYGGDDMDFGGGDDYA